MRKNNFYLLLSNCAAIAYLASTPLYASTSEDPMVGAASSRMGSRDAELTEIKEDFEKQREHYNASKATCEAIIAQYEDILNKKAAAERNLLSARARVSEDFIRRHPSSEEYATELGRLPAAIRNDQDAFIAQRKSIDEKRVENFRLQLERIQLELATYEELLSRSKLPTSFEEAINRPDVLKEKKAELERKMDSVSDAVIRDLEEKLENTRFKESTELLGRLTRLLRLSGGPSMEGSSNYAEYQEGIANTAYHRQTLLLIQAEFEDEIRKLEADITKREVVLLSAMGF